MKRLGSLGLLLLMIQIGRAGDAVQLFPNSTFIMTGDFPNGAGFAFRAKVPLLLTALRYDFVPNLNGISTGRVDLLNASGQLLATALISTNHIVSGVARVEIHPPLVIPAGTTNFLQSATPFQASAPASPDHWIGGLITAASAVIAPELEYLGMGRGLNLNEYAPDFFSIGGNFQFETIPLVTLQISVTNSHHVRLSWPAAAGNYVLHSGPAPDAPMTPVGQLPELIGAEQVVLLPVQTTDCFFRLVR